MQTMREMQHVDLDSRIGKAPGGYNYPLYETGVPFIFMNSVNSLRDLITMVHEGGHAVHSFLCQDKEFVAFKDTPSEVAELASMSMELISMDHWNVFFTDQDELNRAKTQQLEKVISQLPWIAAIDKFQHWLYTNPEHTATERKAEWTKINQQFAGNVTDYTGQEDFFGNSWQRQLHLFQVPFYYIEYGMAQLGAIAMWRNFKKDSTKGLQNYMEALKLGYTRSIGDIYQQGGIRFDFSQAYINELAGFVKKQMHELS
jgi:oligoendopeptidase F